MDVYTHIYVLTTLKVNLASDDPFKTHMNIKGKLCIAIYTQCIVFYKRDKWNKKKYSLHVLPASFTLSDASTMVKWNTVQLANTEQCGYLKKKCFLQRIL